MTNCNIQHGIAVKTLERMDRTAFELIECIHQVASQIDHIPLPSIPVFLGATAGMRMANLVDPENTRLIERHLEQRFKEAHINIKRISIMTGQQEGLYAWVTANYLKETFFLSHEEEEEWKHAHANYYSKSDELVSTFGILDLGGASAQIAHQVVKRDGNDKPVGTNEDKSMVSIRLYGKDFQVSTFSNLCMGIEQAKNR